MTSVYWILPKRAEQVSREGTNNRVASVAIYRAVLQGFNMHQNYSSLPTLAGLSVAPQNPFTQGLRVCGSLGVGREVLMLKGFAMRLFTFALLTEEKTRFGL